MQISKCERLEYDMQNDADLSVAQILQAEESFLIEIGRLTMLFGRIEDALVHDAAEFAQIGNDKTLQEASVSPKLLQSRILEKREFLKRVTTEIGRFYDVDCKGVYAVLDELGNINKLRRSIVHGWIRWSVA